MTQNTLHSIAARLPFHLDDHPQVNILFMRLRQHQQTQDKHTIDLWTYCYIYRYFLMKLTTSHNAQPTHLDKLVANAFADVQKNASHIRQPDHYTGWVSTICKHRFVNYLRTRKSTLSLEDDTLTVTFEENYVAEAHDTPIVYQTICTAINALPEFLRDITRMRLLEQKSYKEIASLTGHSSSILRSYMSKATRKLRQDPRLRAMLEEMHD